MSFFSKKPSVHAHGLSDIGYAAAADIVLVHILGQLWEWVTGYVQASPVKISPKVWVISPRCE